MEPLIQAPDEPTTLLDLPPELHFKLAQYLGEDDLKRMRSVTKTWNTISKMELRKRTNWSFSFENVDKLAHFNQVFAKYTPRDDFTAAAFCVKLPVLVSASASTHLRTFLRQFGPFVRALTVDLKEDTDTFFIDPGCEWFTEDTVRNTVLGHVTILLAKVRGHVQDLKICHYSGLRPAVIGQKPFPRLRTLTIGSGRVRMYDEEDPEYTAGEHPALEEGCMLALTEKVPAIQRFELNEYVSPNDGDPAFVANVLRNLVRTNPELEVKLYMNLLFWPNDIGPIGDLMTVAVRPQEIVLRVSRSEAEQQKALNWIEAQSDWLKKLDFGYDDEHLATVSSQKFPRLRALEGLTYIQETEVSLLVSDSPGHFPNLRRVTTVFTGNDFTVPWPTVTDLTLIRSRMSHWARRGGQQVPQLPPFPNLEKLTLPLYFFNMAEICALQSLVRLTLTLGERHIIYPEELSAAFFWKKVTQGARKLTLKRIRALPEPLGNGARSSSKPQFTDLPRLKEVTVMSEGYDREKLDTFLFLSKKGQLQRLEKLAFELEGADNSVIPEVNLMELRKYHSSVVIKVKIIRELALLIANCKSKST